MPRSIRSRNADNGLAAGVEVEFRKEIVKNLAINANASYMYTNVILPEGGVYTNPQRFPPGRITIPRQCGHNVDS